MWEYDCEPQNTPVIDCDDAIAYILSEAVGDGDAPTSGDTWDVNTPDDSQDRVDVTYGTDPGDRTITLTPPSRP